MPKDRIKIKTMGINNQDTKTRTDKTKAKRKEIKPMNMVKNLMKKPTNLIMVLTTNVWAVLDRSKPLA